MSDDRIHLSRTSAHSWQPLPESLLVGLTTVVMMTPSHSTTWQRNWTFSGNTLAPRTPTFPSAPF